MQNLTTIASQPILFVLLVLLVVSIGFTLSRTTTKRTHKFKSPEPTCDDVIFAHIRELSICHQCDTVFNTILCPNCGEDALIALYRLTGSFDNLESMKRMEKRRAEKKAEAEANTEIEPTIIPLTESDMLPIAT